MISKRIRARVAVQWPVEYRHAGRNGDGMLMELSLHGCRIKGTPPFSCGMRLRLQFLPSAQVQPVEIEQAVVRWSKADQFGVSFLEMSSGTLACLAQVFQLLNEAQQPKARVISCLL